MGTLTKAEIIRRIKLGELIKNAHKLENGNFDVEPASYDLRAGIIIWKETNPLNNVARIETKRFNPNIPLADQEIVTLQPGQVMFVITHEEIIMPKELCGTVYAKNKFSRDGILALTTGHVDPGIQCPIVIRLINLRSIPYTFLLGEQIYTIVFHSLDVNEQTQLTAHPAISMEYTIQKTIESANAALGNALNDLSITHDLVRRNEFDMLKDQTELFLKKEELGKAFRKILRANIYKIIVWVVAALVAIMTIISGWPTVRGWFK